MPPFEPSTHGPVTRNLWPFAISASRVVSGMRDSTAMSPGYIVWGNGDAGKLREDQRGHGAHNLIVAAGAAEDRVGLAVSHYESTLQRAARALAWLKCIGLAGD